MNNWQILLKHTRWKKAIETAKKLPPFPLNYSPSVVEIFDQLGLLAGVAFGEVYECFRYKEDRSEFIAWYLDGELALFYIGGEILVNRLKCMETSAELFASLELA